jgi:hypothetical protein
MRMAAFGCTSDCRQTIPLVQKEFSWSAAGNESGDPRSGRLLQAADFKGSSIAAIAVFVGAFLWDVSKC